MHVSSRRSRIENSRNAPHEVRRQEAVGPALAVHGVDQRSLGAVVRIVDEAEDLLNYSVALALLEHGLLVGVLPVERHVHHAEHLVAVGDLLAAAVYDPRHLVLLHEV